MLVRTDQPFVHRLRQFFRARGLAGKGSALMRRFAAAALAVAALLAPLAAQKRERAQRQGRHACGDRAAGAARDRAHAGADDAEGTVRGAGAEGLAARRAVALRPQWGRASRPVATTSPNTRAEGRVADRDLATIAVDATSVLPKGNNEPSDLAPRPAQRLDGYSRLQIGAGIAWGVGLFGDPCSSVVGVASAQRRRPRSPRSLIGCGRSSRGSRRVRPTPPPRPNSERLLLAFWRARLDLRAMPRRAMIDRRDQAAPRGRRPAARARGWLHMPVPPAATDLAALLQPHYAVTAEIRNPSPRRPTDVRAPVAPAVAGAAAAAAVLRVAAPPPRRDAVRSRRARLGGLMRALLGVAESLPALLLAVAVCCWRCRRNPAAPKEKRAHQHPVLRRHLRLDDGEVRQRQSLRRRDARDQRLPRLPQGRRVRADLLRRQLPALGAAHERSVGVPLLDPRSCARRTRLPGFRWHRDRQTVLGCREMLTPSARRGRSHSCSSSPTASPDIMNGNDHRDRQAPEARRHHVVRRQHPGEHGARRDRQHGAADRRRGVQSRRPEGAGAGVRNASTR